MIIANNTAIDMTAAANHSISCVVKGLATFEGEADGEDIGVNGVRFLDVVGEPEINRKIYITHIQEGRRRLGKE